MNFSKSHTLKSSAYPGIEVTLGRVGPKQRAFLELSLTEPRARERELAIRRDYLAERLNLLLDKAPHDSEGKVIEGDLPAEALSIADQLVATRAELENVQRALIYPVFVKAAVKAMNFTYEGQPATAEMLCEHGPDDLFIEVVRAINSNGYLTVEQTENLSSPSISHAPVDGMTSNSSATNAKSAPDYQSSAAA